MPSLPINNANIGVFSFNFTLDLYNKQAIFDFTGTTYNGSGISLVQGISAGLTDGDGVQLAVIDFTNSQNYIVPSVTQIFTVDLSSLPIAFFFQRYTIQAAIKDQNGTIYTTMAVYKNICQPNGITDGGYVDGMFNVTADCVNNLLSVKECTVLVYNGQVPITVTKSGVLSYPTGTIGQVTFTGTPFENNRVYTGEYNIENTTIATYDLADSCYVLVNYYTNNIFDIICGSKMSDLNCCILDIQQRAQRDANLATGKFAKQQLAEISVPYFLGLSQEIAGQDSTKQYEYIKKYLNCTCGKNKVRQNELNPINPSIYSIVVIGVNGSTVSGSVNGTTKTWTVSSNVYQIVKGNTGDLAFTLAVDNTVSGVTKTILTFNYTVMAGYILTAIGGNGTLIAQLNSLIAATTNIDLTTLDGACIINMSNTNYFLAYLTPNTASTLNSILIGATTYTPPTPILCTNTDGILSYINGLNLGTFTASYSNGYFNLLSNTNPNNPVSVTLGINSSPTVVPFQKTNYSLIAVLQSMVDYMCNLTALQVALGANLQLCTFDYSGAVVVTNYNGTGGNQANQGQFNSGVAAAICNIVNRINTLTGITCAKIQAIFQDYPNAVFNIASDRYLSIVDGNCTNLNAKQSAFAVIAAINAYSDVKAAFCAISCATPGTCPDVSGVSLNSINSSTIGFYGLTWASTTAATQTVTVRYRLTGTTTWTIATTSLQILPNGNILGTTPFPIGGLTAGRTYDIWVQNNCGGVGSVNQITVPAAGVTQGSYLLDTVLYNTCADTPVTLYSALPFATGDEMFYDSGLTEPVTGYTYIVPITTGKIYNLNSTTSIVGTWTGATCTSGTAGSYILGTSTSTICTGTPVTLYTNGVFAVGGILYTDSALTTPVTGYTYVVDGANNHIYNLNSSTGAIGADTGLTCNNNYTVSAAYNLNITNITGTGVPNLGVVNSGQSKSGFQTGISGNLVATITGTVVTSSSLVCYVNNISVRSVAITSAGNYTLTSISTVSTDTVLITIDSGS